MTQIFQKNQEIFSQKGIEYTVQKFLDSDHFGELYLVSRGEKDWVLKWYYPIAATVEQRKALEALTLKGAPTEKFLWPLEIIIDLNVKGYGYIMPLRPKNFKNIVDLLKRKIEPSFFTLSTTGFHLADSFFHLHQKNLAFIDLNFGQFFFNPENGDLIVVDIDNFAWFLSSKTSRYQGTPRFMAPEIVRGNVSPSSDTDRFSLAVLLFYMFFLSHPLEGKKESAIHALDAPAVKKLYGDKPVFIFDPNDPSNTPDPNFHQNALIYWDIYPQFFKDLFTRTFTDGLNDPSCRVSESEWRSAFMILRDSIVFCQNCGCENFYDTYKIKRPVGAPPKCWNCSTTITLPPRIKIGKLVVMLNHNTKFYPYHLDPISYDFSKPIAELSRHPSNPNIWELKNISDRSWQVTKPDGTSMEIPSGKNVSLGNGVRINFGRAEGEIKV